MDLKKIPRKLKKELKKRVLASHSDSYILYRKLTTKKIRILFVNKKTGRFAVGTYK
jgi:hypothetical protein